MSNNKNTAIDNNRHYRKTWKMKTINCDSATARHTIIVGQFNVNVSLCTARAVRCSLKLNYRIWAIAQRMSVFVCVWESVRLSCCIQEKYFWANDTNSRDCIITAKRCRWYFRFNNSMSNKTGKTGTLMQRKRTQCTGIENKVHFSVGKSFDCFEMFDFIVQCKWSHLFVAFLCLWMTFPHNND